MRYFAPIFGFLLLGTAFASDAGLAQPNRAREGVQSGEVRSLNQILNDVRRQRGPGNLADVQGPNFGPSGEPHYRLKWLTPDGRVQWLDTDARTGRVLGVEGNERPGAGPAPGGRGAFGPRGNFAPPQAYGPPAYAPRGNGGFEGAPDENFRRGPAPFRRAPSQEFNGPPPGYNGPPQGYNGPPPGYNGPPQGYNGPPQGFNGAPQRNPNAFNRGGPPQGEGVPRGGFERAPQRAPEAVPRGGFRNVPRGGTSNDSQQRGGGRFRFR